MNLESIAQYIAENTGFVMLIFIYLCIISFGITGLTKKI